jgi:hypothetical protein
MGLTPGRNAEELPKAVRHALSLREKSRAVNLEKLPGQALSFLKKIENEGLPSGKGEISLSAHFRCNS